MNDQQKEVLVFLGVLFIFIFGIVSLGIIANNGIAMDKCEHFDKVGFVTELDTNNPVNYMCYVYLDNGKKVSTEDLSYGMSAYVNLVKK